jgi:alkanesulfonate monooxygenase SsuD/methylene tetrahydromethanopterin reductase-like flavin-dependent oxidoreductase (luciferase family)
VRPKLGVIVPPWYPPEKLHPAAVEAERQGFDQLWLWEDCFKQSGLASAAAALAWTERIEVRVGLLPVPLRNVALLAMEAATLDRLFPGRFRPVVGHGVQDWMQQAGARSVAPLTLLREYVVALTRLLAGDVVTVQGRFVQLDAVRLDWPPVEPMGVMAGATGPRTLEAMGAVASGVLIDSGNSPEDLRDLLRLVHRGAADAGRPDLPEAAVYVHTALGDDAAARLAAHLGDAALDRGLAGSAQDVVEGIGRYADAGAASVVLRPLEDEPDIVAFIRALGSEVVPRLRA